MAIKKMPISQFMAEVEAALNRKDGYIMGAKGQNPKKWATNSWWFTQYKDADQKKKALYWRENAARVWDCNGLAEGIYQDWSGVDINTYARSNYANWCGSKGTGTIPAQYRVPGAAVFIYSKSEGYITHVGYLYKPVNVKKPGGDWYVIEARGVMHGVVKTKLSQRGWNRWGLMTKYFDYASANVEYDDPELGDRILRNGMEGEDVRDMQINLIALGYDCGKWGADGDFGDATEIALMKFQREHGCDDDGEYGPITHKAMTAALAALKPVAAPRTVRIVGGDCWVRTAPNTSGKKLGVAKAGTVLLYGGETADNGWLLIEFENQNGFVSGKYARLEN